MTTWFAVSVETCRMTGWHPWAHERTALRPWRWPTDDESWAFEQMKAKRAANDPLRDVVDNCDLHCAAGDRCFYGVALVCATPCSSDFDCALDEFCNGAGLGGGMHHAPVHACVSTSR